MNRRPFLKLFFFISSIFPFRLVGSTILSVNNLVSFQHGVASGDPTNENVIIWTRVTPSNHSYLRVVWQVASDKHFKNIIQRGVVKTSQKNDFTVKADPYIPKEYNNKKIYYRFIADGVISPIGQTKTLPKYNPDEFNLAFCSCSNYPGGYFNAYKEMALNKDIDVFLHLGDYIYEYDDKGYASENALSMDRVVDPLHEIITLSDYRKRHAQYKTDFDLQKLHSSKPMIAVWDDHEFTNDSWKDGAENHQTNEGSFKKRKANALKAYYEWMPIRELKSKFKIWKKFEIGTLFQLLMIDTRSIYRDKQLLLDNYIQNDVFDKNSYLNDLYKNRSLVGKEQFNWLENSINDNFKWTIVGQQVMVAEVHLPKIFSFMDKNLLPEYLHKYLQIGGMKIPYNTDAWDGYPNERNKLFNILSKANSSIVLTGDTHNSWISNLYDKDNFIGVEIATPSISSPNTIDSFGSITDKIEASFINENKNVSWTNGKGKGYVNLKITNDEILAIFNYVSTVKSKEYTNLDPVTFKIKHNKPYII